jgi:hypothetical protein
MASVKGTDYSYYASKSELLSWVNSLLQLQLTRLEQVRDRGWVHPAPIAPTRAAPGASRCCRSRCRPPRPGALSPLPPRAVRVGRGLLPAAGRLPR